MTTFRCGKCKFEIVRGKNPGRCPYCGNGEMDEKPNAQDFLNETIDDFDEIERQREERQ